MNNMKLLKKELTFGNNLSMIMWFSCMLLMQIIPNYPLYIGPFYLTLCIMMTFALNQTSHDILYTALLPVRKIDTVKARFLYCLIMECACILVSVIWGVVRAQFNFPQNDAGINLNVAYVGFQLVLFAVFNLIFLGSVYKDPLKPGLRYAIGAVTYFICYAIVELPVWFYKGRLSGLLESGVEIDNAIAQIQNAPWYSLPRIGSLLFPLDAASLLRQLPVLLVGVAVFVISWPLTFRRAARQFEKYDL